MRLFLSFTLFFRLLPAIAGNIAGGDISYQYLGKNRYLIVVKLLRDCKGDSMDKPNFGVYNGNSGGNSCGSSTINSFKRIRITDITTRCGNSKKACSPQNTNGTGRGIEEQVYVDTADFTKTPYSTYLTNICSEITFYISMPYRIKTTTIATTSGFALTTSINIANLKKCAVQTNTGPAWGSSGENVLCCQLAAYTRLSSTFNPDGDTTFYHLVPALSSIPSTPVSYFSPFTYQHPLTPYCVPSSTILCTPNLKTDPPRGFFFDTVFCDVIFTPTKCDEISVLAMEAIEYRQDFSGNYIEIGRARREITYFIDDSCGFNKSPAIKGPFSSNICEGDKICYSIYGTDETYTPYQTVPDTVKLTWTDTIAGASFKIKNPKDREKEAVFCWQTKAGDGSPNEYSFVVTANDQHCPRPVVYSRGFKIRVNKKFTVKPLISIISKSCGRIKAVCSKSNVSDATYSWSALNINSGNLYSGIYENDTFISNILPKGTYKLNLKTTYPNSCGLNPDTFVFVTLDSYVLTTIDHGTDTSLCKNETILVNPSIQNGFSPYKAQWFINGIVSSADTFLALKLKVLNSPLKVNLIVTDKNGCRWPSMHGNNYTKVIDVKYPPNIQLGPDRNLCGGDSALLNAGNFANATCIWNTGSTKNKITVKKTDQYFVKVSIPNGCVGLDTIIINILRIPVYSSLSNGGFCQSKILDSGSLNSLILEDGIPIKNQTPVYKMYAFNNDTKSLELNKDHIRGTYFSRWAFLGVWTLTYNFNYFYCPVSDSLRFSIFPLPEPDFTTNPPVGHENGLFLVNNKSTIPDNSKMRFHWNFGRNAADTTNSKEPLLQFGNNIANYSVLLIATSNKGCIDSVRKTIQVLAGVSKPLPAGFAMDDKLIISGKELKSVKLFLYNTNGQLVLHNNDNSGIGNTRLTAGVYVYKLNILKQNGEEIPVGGKVELNSDFRR